MNTRKTLLLLSLVVVALIAAACGSTGDTDSDNDTTENTTIELAQTYTGDDSTGGSITVNYPEGWFQSGDVNNGLTFTNVENVDEIEPGTVVESGQMMTVVMVISADLAPLMAGSDEVTSLNILTGFSAFFAEGDDAPEMGASEEVTVAGTTGAVATGDSAAGSVIMMVMPRDGGAYVMSFAMAATGELDSVRPTVEAIITSAEYTPAAASE
jgi:hypothetical protein